MQQLEDVKKSIFVTTNACRTSSTITWVHKNFLHTLAMFIFLPLPLFKYQSLPKATIISLECKNLSIKKFKSMRIPSKYYLGGKKIIKFRLGK